MAKIDTLLKLVNSSVDEYSSTMVDALPEDIRAALVEAQADERKNVAKAAAAEIINLMKAVDVRTESHVESIRSARRREAEAKANLSELSTAKAYALETNNWFPVMTLLGNISPSDCFSLKAKGVQVFVPEGWQPKVAKPAAKSSVKKA